MKKQINVIVLSVSLVTGLTGCGNNQMKKDAEKFGVMFCELTELNKPIKEGKGVSETEAQKIEKLKAEFADFGAEVKEKYEQNTEDKKAFMDLVTKEIEKCGINVNKIIDEYHENNPE
ncbi:MAG TPA: hypothetical protein VD905_08320 [Flavobacteriales bacterium]|nr:hypothetical protein [Flavobacteriales bacterium]